MSRRQRGVPTPGTDSTVAGASWEGEDLSGREYSRVRFVDLDLTEAEGRGAVFSECEFRGARFNASVHDGCAFLNCAFSGCNFFDARFSGCKLVGSVFDRCTFEHDAGGGRRLVAGGPAGRRPALGLVLRE